VVLFSIVVVMFVCCFVLFSEHGDIHGSDLTVYRVSISTLGYITPFFILMNSKALPYFFKRAACLMVLASVVAYGHVVI
jgi:hypothetical protein